MIKKTLIILSAFMFLSLMGCKTTKTYTDNFAPLRTDDIVKITIEIQSDTLTSLMITDVVEMKDFITDLNSSKFNGPWKGVEWDKIVLYFENDTTIFSTNGEVFGQGPHGFFYDLNNKYKKYWKQ